MTGIPVAVVTGGTSGIGLEVVRRLAGRGYRVLVLGRHPQRLGTLAQPGGNVLFVPCDLLVRREVERAAQAVLGETARVDLLVHAAGALYWSPTRTPDGAEANIALHHLAGFGLTRSLLGALEAAPVARVLGFSSVTHRGVKGLPEEVLDFARPRLGGYTALGAFARAKLLALLGTCGWETRLAGSAVSFASFAPPSTHTEGFFSPSMPSWLRALRPVSRLLLAPAGPVGETAVALLTGEAWRGGAFFEGSGRAARPHGLTQDPEWVERVWTASERWWTRDAVLDG